MNEAAKHLQNALAELRKAKPHLQGAEDSQACTEAIFCTEILANKYTEEDATETHAHIPAHRHD